MNSMRRRLMVLLAVILLFFQLISVVWLWHESREQIGFLVSETLSAKARNQHVEKEIREAIASLLVPSMVMVGFTLLFSFWAVTWITRPLNQLRTSLANRSADNLTPLPMYSDMEEIGAVTTSLNQLLARLDQTIQQERLFTADAAHELRTPLAGIRLHLELMAQSGAPQASALIARIDQLMHTVEQLLMLARAGQAMASGHYETVSWSKTILAPLALEQEPKAHTLIWPQPNALTVQGDAVLLRLMLRNLLENAARYSPDGTTIDVRIQETDG
ncbi:MAG: two-component system sensor histidine kinase PmrB, partial [Hafnia sp.]